MKPERPWFLHPAAFLTAWVLLGVLFALQEYVSVRTWHYPINYLKLLVPWSLYFFLWGIFCQIMWWKFRPFIGRATTKSILLWVIPISIVVSVLQEAIWVAFQPQLPMGLHNKTYLHRLQYYLDSEFTQQLVIFWFTFCLFRAILIYQRFREREFAAAQLETQLTQAQLRALRMQLNPHFLFNTMNSVSSLMRSDMEAATRCLNN